MTLEIGNIAEHLLSIILKICQSACSSRNHCHHVNWRWLHPSMTLQMSNSGFTPTIACFKLRCVHLTLLLNLRTFCIHGNSRVKEGERGFLGHTNTAPVNLGCLSQRMDLSKSHVVCAVNHNMRLNKITNFMRLVIA